MHPPSCRYKFAGKRPIKQRKGRNKCCSESLQHSSLVATRVPDESIQYYRYVAMQRHNRSCRPVLSPTVQTEAWLALGLWCDKKRVHGKFFGFMHVSEITGKTASATSPSPPSWVSQIWMKGRVTKNGMSGLCHS